MSVQRKATEQDLREKAHEVLQSQPSSTSSSSSSLNPLSLHWGDLEGNFVSLQNSIETRLKELEIKETQVNDRLRELESREKEIARLSNALDFDYGPVLGSIGGKKLLTLLTEPMSRHVKLCECVRRALESSEDPAKLVLEAVGEFYGEEVESGFSVSDVGKKSCLVLLEQLAKAAPMIGAAEKAEAARLAREWRAKIRGEGQNGLLEVLGFLLLVGAYDLVDEFDSGEMLGVFRSIGKHDQKVGHGLGVGTGWGSEFDHDSDKASTSPVSQENPKQSLEDDLELVNQIASAFTSTFEALKCFCVAMDGKNLKLFLYQYLEEHDSWSTEVREALRHAPDPAKLVLEAIPGFLRTQPEFHKKLNTDKVRKSSILLMEQLMVISPPISPNVREEGLKLAEEWGSNLGSVYQRPVTVYGYLLFLASYRLESKCESDELLRLLGIASQYKAFPGLCQALGLSDKAEVLIQSLIQKTMLLEAVDNIYAYGLLNKFQPVRFLRGYLSYTKKRLYKKGDQSSSQQKWAMNKEIAAIKNVLKYVAKYKLESKYSPKELEKQILQLEEKKGKIIDNAEPSKPKADRKKNVTVQKGKVNGTAESKKPKADQEKNETCGTNTTDSQVKVEPPPKEDLQSEDPVVKSEPSPNEELKFVNEDEVKTGLSLNIDLHPGNQASSSPASPWPLLETFCVNMYGKGLSFFSHKHKDESDSANSPSPSRWPELKTICLNMDGKSLRTFVYDHMDENESFSGEVFDSLKHSSDPARLVLDAMPGCLRTQPEFDESLQIKRVRNCRILLLEQLIALSIPEISPVVKEEALTMANEWRANLGFKFKGADNVFGFLNFIAAFGLVSNFKDEVLIDLLVPANQRKPCPDLCRILGFTDKALVVIEILIQNSLVLEAIEHIYSFSLVDKFSPVLLLKDYVNSKTSISKDGTNLPSKKAIDTEIAAARSVIKCVAKYKLESELPIEELERHISELEMQKALVNNPLKNPSSSQNVQA